MIRVDANEGAGSPDDNIHNAAAASNTGEEEGYSSDGSVIRVPARNAGAEDGVEGLPRQPEGEVEKGPDDGANDGKIRQPAHMRQNLLAASKYFGSKGGVSDVDPGAEAQRNRPGQVSAMEHDNPQVRLSGSM